MKNKNGFTLVELLAVIGILAILTTIAIPSVLVVSQKIKKSVWEGKLKTVAAAVELWANDNKADCESQINNLTVEKLVIAKYIKADEANKFNNPTTGDNKYESKVTDLGIGVDGVCDGGSATIIADGQIDASATITFDLNSISGISAYSSASNIDPTTNKEGEKYWVEIFYPADNWPDRFDAVLRLPTTAKVDGKDVSLDASSWSIENQDAPSDAELFKIEDGILYAHTVDRGSVDISVKTTKGKTIKTEFENYSKYIEILNKNYNNSTKQLTIELSIENIYNIEDYFNFDFSNGSNTYESDYFNYSLEKTRVDNNVKYYDLIINDFELTGNWKFYVSTNIDYYSTTMYNF